MRPRRFKSVGGKVGQIFHALLRDLLRTQQTGRVRISWRCRRASVLSECRVPKFVMNLLSLNVFGVCTVYFCRKRRKFHIFVDFLLVV